MKFILATIISFVFVSANFVNAQEVSYTPSLLVVDVQRVLAESQAAKALKAELDTRAKKISEDFAAREEALRKDQQGLIANEQSLDQEAFNETRIDIERRAVSLRQDRAQARRAIDTVADQARKIIAEQVKKISLSIAAERGANIVVERAIVIVMAEDFDITSELIERLDEVLPEIKLTEKTEG